MSRTPLAASAALLFALALTALPAGAQLVETPATETPATEPPAAEAEDASTEAAPADAAETTGETLSIELDNGRGLLALKAVAMKVPDVGPRVDLGPSLDVGRARFSLGGGVRAHLMTAGGEPVGVYLSGPIAFEYRVEDRFSIPVAQRNLGEGIEAKGTMRDGALVIADRAGSVAIWGRGLGRRAEAKVVTGEASGGEASGGKTAFSPRLRTLLATSLFRSAPAMLMGDPSGEASYALIGAKRGDLLLYVDPQVARTESLLAITDVSRYNQVQRGMSRPINIISQPIGRQWWERQNARSPLLLEHQDIELENPSGNLVRSRSTSRVLVRDGSTSIWAPEVSSEYYWDEDIHRVEVTEVRVDGEAADYYHDDGVLLVDLGRELKAGERFEATVEFVGGLARRPGNDSYWRPVASWRPSMGLDGELATFDITMKTPDPYVPFASGDTVERRQEDGFNILVSKVDELSSFPVVSAGRYHMFSDEQDGYTCNVATYVFGKEKPAKVLQGLFFSAAQIFEQFYGVPYPFAEVDVVEINQWGWGQAPDGVIFITQEAYNPLASDTSRFYSQGINARFVHEVAHAWWGHVIKMDSWEEQWLTESFADYSAALAMQAMQPGKRGEREFNKILREWRSNASQIGEGGSIYLANELDSVNPTDDDHLDRLRLLYNKGPLVLHALRQELGRRVGGAEQGDRYFQALLKTFATNFAGGFGETRHLVGILNQMTSSDWQPWFEKYVYGTETPEVEI